MTEFLKELYELLAKHNAIIWASTDTGTNQNRIGIEKDGKDFEIDNGLCEVCITSQSIRSSTV